MQVLLNAFRAIKDGGIVAMAVPEHRAYARLPFWLVRP